MPTDMPTDMQTESQTEIYGLMAMKNKCKQFMTQYHSETTKDGVYSSNQRNMAYQFKQLHK